jgi:hypothetical protein
MGVGVNEIDVAHDDWCALLKSGLPCNCDPDVRVRPPTPQAAPPPPQGPTIRAESQSSDLHVAAGGVRVEAFTAGFVQPGFVPAVGWQLGAPGASLHMTYQSEWARILTPLEVADLEARGIDPALHMWWPAVAAHVLVDPRAHPAGAHLPLNGNVVHLRPLDVMTWLNQVTWGSEWPKYNIAGARPARPRSRWV